MSLTVTQRPYTTIGGETSNWNAVGNPIIYKLQRKDFTFTSINNDAGFAQLVITGDVTASILANDVIYFQTDAGVYAVASTVTTSVYSAPDTLVTTSTSYISSSTGWLNDDTFRPLYGVDIKCFSFGDVSLNDEAFNYTPNSAGLITVDISTIIKANISPDNGVTYGTALDNDDAGSYTTFYIKYTEAWTGSAESQSSDILNQFYAVYGARQVPSTYGGNLAEYVTFDGNPPGSVSQFLTKFDNPKMWRDWPFYLSVILDGITDAAVRVKKDTVNLDTGALTSSGALRVIDVNEFTLGDISTAKQLNFNIYDSVTSAVLSEVLDVNLADACEQPIMLMARNSLGGVLQWMFDINQEYSFDYGDGRKAKRLILYAQNLTVNEWEGLQDFITLGDVYKNNIVEFSSSTIKTSSRIGQQVYVVSSTGVKTGVTVIPTKNRTMTKRKKHSFEIEIEYPEVFAL